ncbi:hypothetical protein LPN04_32115 [Rugamonas sp. A1-17]|nr:hypothetical protein [Rugamonas sp. A1-17]
MIPPNSTTPSVTIFAARTWGRIGNFAAAKNVQTHLLAHTGAEAVLVAFEEMWPRFAEFGAAMRDAARETCPTHTARLFAAIMAEVDDHLRRMLAGDPSDEYRGIEQRLVQMLQQQRPAVVISTKGVITQLLAVVRERHRLPFRLVNWITNTGLLDLGCHQARQADLHVVPSADARGKVLAWGVGERPVLIAGPVIRFAPETALPVAPQAAALPLCVAYFHNVNAAVVAQLELLLARCPARIHAIVPLSAQAAAAPLVALQARHEGRLAVHGELSQQAFHGLLKSLKQTQGVFIAKSGPNTMFEAVAMNIPFVLYRSGLPQEDWVLDYIEQQQIGGRAEEIGMIAARALALLSAPDEQALHLQKQRALWRALAADCQPPAILYPLLLAA